MKTHRNIIIISFTIIALSLPFLIILDKGKIYEIMLALFTSAVISFLLELPNYLTLKKVNKDKLYLSLLYAKSNALFLINNIKTLKTNNQTLFDKFYSQNVSDINNNLITLESYDSNYYFNKNKNDTILNVKNNIRNAWHNINLATLKYSVSFTQLKLEKFQKHESETIFTTELNKELDLILEATNIFIKSIEDTISLIFTREQITKWTNDNILLENTELNSKITKI